VLDKLDKIQDDVSDLKVEQAKQGKDIGQNTKDLSEHIEGVKQNRARLELHGAQLTNLQAPAIAAGQIKKWALWFGGIAGAVLAVYKLYMLL
jgi:hypothetical protein